MRRCRFIFYTIADSPRSCLSGGRAQPLYRSRGGTRQIDPCRMSLIGAHAVIERCELLTRDGPGLCAGLSCAAAHPS